jgi:hypothetical protein
VVGEGHVSGYRRWYNKRAGVRSFVGDKMVGLHVLSDKDGVIGERANVCVTRWFVKGCATCLCDQLV